MNDLRRRLKDDLAAAGCSPLHRFGQNFMVDARAIERLVATAAIRPGDTVVEIGPGTGHLTAALLDAGARVVAVEIDRGLHAHLQGAFAGRALELHLGDCLDGKDGLHPAILAAAAGPWRLAANLPYDAAIPAILNAAALATPLHQPSAIAVTVQREAAERLCSAPGGEAWGASAAVLQAAGVPRIAQRLGPGSFHPAPRVDSAILGWTPHAALPAGFAPWVRRVFAYRRKVLAGALRDAGCEREAGIAACTAAGLDPQRRLESLTPDELLRLHAQIPP